MRNKPLFADEEVSALIAKHRQNLPVAQALEKQPEVIRPTIFDMKITMSICETAASLSLSQKAVERLIKRGELRVKRVGRRVLVPVSEIELWLNRKD